MDAALKKDMLRHGLNLPKKTSSSLTISIIIISFFVYSWWLLWDSSSGLLYPSQFKPLICKYLPASRSCNHGNIRPHRPPQIGHIAPSKRGDKVKEAFQSAFQSYWEICKGHDELAPVSGKCKNSRNQWGASAVDALSTAIIMEHKATVIDLLDFIQTIDFTTTDDLISLFETTIRYLGGLLSAYDLLKEAAPFFGLDEAAIAPLLNQSRSLADQLKFAFNTPTGIPHNDIYINQTWSQLETNGLATTGSLILEWNRLSDLTGDPTYGDLASKAESYLLKPHPSYNVPFPGLLGTKIDIESGYFLDAAGGWNGGDDSYYEYLIKMYVYDPVRFVNYRDAWIEAADSSIKFLASHPSGRSDVTFLAAYANQTILPFGTHLGCFAGGNFLLGGEVLGRKDYVDFGLELVNGCHETYNATTTGIGPEVFSWNNTDLASHEESFYKDHGFWIEKAKYVLRPEVIESYYYAYRVTGNPVYQEWAWDAFLAIDRTCRVDRGYSSISNVDKADGGEILDEQESFLFAEVMKYSYMIQAEDAPWQVNYKGRGVGRNDFVYNTEAHPLRVARQGT